MSVVSVLTALQASRKDGCEVTGDMFLAPLNIQPGEVKSARADGGQWAAGLVYLAVVRCSDFEDVDTSDDAGAQSEAFFAGIINAFHVAAQFLDRRPPEVMDAMRRVGLSLRLLIDVRMDLDQMELEFPSDFLAACGRQKLGVYVITNDVSAAEVSAARRSAH